MGDCVDVDYVELLVEEIALEGLDGITLSALWIRLTNRPNFEMVLDEPAKNYLWEICAFHPDVEGYLLPEPRPPLIIYNRFTNIDADTGLINEPGENYIDIYPICISTNPDVFGSCTTYDTRTNVTTVLRAENGDHVLPLKKATEKWGERLVLVASAERRLQVLLGNEADPRVRLNQIQYAMLERIGRSRYLGEVTQGRCSLSGLHSCAKTLFYHRKLLLKLGLISKQLHYQKSINGQLRSGMLLHLTRFYVERKSKVILMIQEMCRFLQSKPDHSSSLDSIRKHIGLKQNVLKHTLKKCLDKIAEAKTVAVRDYIPDASNEQIFYNNKSLKMIRVLRLRDNVDPDNLEKFLNEEDGESGKGGGKKKKAGSDDEDDEEMEETEEEGDRVELDKRIKLALRKHGIPDPCNQVIDRPLLHQAYTLFEKLGPQGGSIQQFGALMGVPRLETRALCRNLKRLGVVSAIMKDSGRQRVTRYIAKRYTSTSQEHQELIKECQKLLEFTKGSTDPNAKPMPSLEESESKTPDAVSSTSTSTQNSQAHAEAVTIEQCTMEEAGTSGIKHGPGSFMQNIQKICQEVGGDEGLSLTSKLVKRANLILQAVREAKVISNHITIQKLIVTSEAGEGTRVDRKSIFRLIQRLAKEGHLKYVHSVLKHGNKERKIHLVCDPSLPNDDPLILSALEQAKFKYFAITDELSKVMHRDVKRSKETIKDSGAVPKPETPVQMSVMELRNLYDSNMNRSLLEFNCKIGRLYGHEPKFMRMKSFHEFVFYLVYGYEGNEDCLTPAEVKNEELKHNLTLPKVYHRDISWKMFVSPLPTHAGWRVGWCLFSDVLLRLPLSLLVKLVNYNFKIEGIHEYLNDPIRRHIPISRLPQKLRNYLLYARKYIFSSHDVATKLAYMGLLSFSQKDHKEKDQVFMFIHRKARVVDTTISKPGYHNISTDVEYPARDYYLQTLADLHNFWIDLETVCMNTPLGSYSHDVGKTLTFEAIFRKQALIDAAASKKDEELDDSWSIPGDRLGAGGLDSAFFSHLKRNWSWVTVTHDATKSKDLASSQPSKATTSKKKSTGSIPATAKPSSLMVTLLAGAKGSQSSAPVTKQRLARLAINTQLNATIVGTKDRPIDVGTNSQSKKTSKQKALIPKSAKKSTVRLHTLKSNFRRIRKPYYDEKDRAALKLVRRQRVGWSSKEDSMLLLCKVASNLFNDNAKLFIVPFSAIRDFLHRHVEVSRDKTSRACQRRLHYILKNPQTAFNISVFVGESLQDQNIVDLCNLPRLPRTCEAEWIQRFEAIMEKLLVKFKISTGQIESSSFDLPNTMEEFRNCYNLKDAKELLSSGSCQNDVKNVVDIHFNVVSTLILSSVATVSDGTNWAYYLYQIYRQYPESLLLSALAKLRSSLVLSKRKSFGRGAKRRMLLVMLPYQLSIKYDYIFLCQFREHIFPEAHGLMQNLLDNAMEGDKGVSIALDHEGGYAAAIISLTATKKVMFEITVPDEVIVLNLDDSKLDHHCKAFLKKMQAWENKIKNVQEDSLVQLTKKAQQSGDSGGANVVESNEESSQPAKRPRLELTASTPNEAVPSTSKCPADEGSKTVRCLLDVESGASKINVPPLTRSSRFALYMLRQEITETLLENTQHSSDYLVIKPCGIQCRLSNMPSPLQKSHPFSKEEIARIFRKVTLYLPIGDVPMDNVIRHYFAQGHSVEVVTEMEDIFLFIFQRNELGVKIDDLRAWFKTKMESCHLPLAEHLKLMTSCHLVITVGVVVRRYVAFSRAKPWLIHTYKIKNASGQDETLGLASSDVGSRHNPPPRIKAQLLKGIPPPDFNDTNKEAICFIGRSWRKPNGNVNVQALRFLLNGIMTYIMSYPGVTYASLCEKYAVVLSPVQLLELLEILEESKCIHRMIITRSHESTLFSPPVTIQYGDEMDPWAKLCFDPDVDCVIKLGQLLSDEAMGSI